MVGNSTLSSVRLHRPHRLSHAGVQRDRSHGAPVVH
jgi:hypothetical protein